jgi:excinuclease ABC subunit C
MKKFAKLIKQIPKLSGVYIYKDAKNTIIYVGKAKNLFNRVKSYFNKNNDIKTRTLVKKIDKIEYFVTGSEVEALILENNFIKQNLPKYNIKLKDAKSYPLMKITNENLPRITICREKNNKKDEYFGPFVDVHRLRNIIVIFRKYLKLRTCKLKFTPPYRYKPCLNYFIKICSAPCAGYISEEEYLKTVDIARKILQGNIRSILEVLEKSMKENSEKQEYEKAASVRDQIQSIKELGNEQIVENINSDDSDYVGVYNDFKMASISIIQNRNGKIIGKENFIVSNIIEYSNILIDFLNSYYLSITQFPKKIFIQENTDGIDILKEAINRKYNIEIDIMMPAEQKDKKLLQLSRSNAEFSFEEKKYKLDKIHHLRELKKVLELDRLPRTIECFDIATLDGKFNTAAMVTFKDGKPDKTNYRQFNVEGEGHPDDYAMMEEVIARRYQKLKNEKLPMPDLIVVDGGKGQVTSAINSLDILDLKIPVIGLAKKYEHIFTRNSKNPLILSKDSMALKLLQNVRDEAHRFSNTRLSKRFKNDSLLSVLSDIEGIGEKRVNLLLKHFKSVSAIKKASTEEIASVETIGTEIAKKVFDYFHGE